MSAKIKTRHQPGHHLRHKPRGIGRHAFEQVYWPYIPIVAAICVLLGLTVKTGSMASLIHHPTSRVLSYATNSSVNDLLADTNTARVDNGQRPLHLNSSLDLAAQAKANDMATRDYWSHTTPDGTPPWSFVTAENYSYQKLGENLAAGFINDQAVINAWLASPGHRANLLDPSYSDVGFGFANIPNYSAAGGGPMTVVVSFYGEPVGIVVGAPTPADSQAANSSNLVLGQSDSQPTSRLQLALARSRLAAWTTVIIIALVAGTAGLWIGRHLVKVRRAVKKGERYAYSHPLMDLGFVIILVLVFVLSRSAGFTL